MVAELWALSHGNQYEGPIVRGRLVHTMCKNISFGVKTHQLANEKCLLQCTRWENQHSTQLSSLAELCDLVLCCGAHIRPQGVISAPSKLLEIPVTLKIWDTMSGDTELHADRIQPSTVASCALLTCLVGVCSWPPLAIHLMYCLRNSALKGRFTLTSSGCSMPVRPPGIPAVSPAAPCSYPSSDRGSCP